MPPAARAFRAAVLALAGLAIAPLLAVVPLALLLPATGWCDTALPVYCQQAAGDAALWFALPGLIAGAVLSLRLDRAR